MCFHLLLNKSENPGCLAVAILAQAAAACQPPASGHPADPRQPPKSDWGEWVQAAALCVEVMALRWCAALRHRGACGARGAATHAEARRPGEAPRPEDVLKDVEALRRLGRLTGPEQYTRAVERLARAHLWGQALRLLEDARQSRGLEVSPDEATSALLAQLQGGSAPAGVAAAAATVPPPPLDDVRGGCDKQAACSGEEQEEEVEEEEPAGKEVEEEQQRKEAEEEPLSYSLLPDGSALVDLHGLPVEVAKVAVQVALEDILLGGGPGAARRGAAVGADIGDLIIVTGRGKHSPGGVALVRPAIIEFLREQLQLKTKSVSPGRLKVPARELRRLRGVPEPSRH